MHTPVPGAGLIWHPYSQAASVSTRKHLIPTVLLKKTDLSAKMACSQRRSCTQSRLDATLFWVSVMLKAIGVHVRADIYACSIYWTIYKLRSVSPALRGLLLATCESFFVCVRSRHCYIQGVLVCVLRQR